MVRLALSLGVTLPQREAQTLLPLVAEALELHARALCSVEQSRWRSKDRTKLSLRLADLMAGLLKHSHGSLEEAAGHICEQLERRCLPWALSLGKSS